MIDTSPFNRRSAKGVLYYVRLKTHGSSRLFDLPEDSLPEYSESSVLVASYAKIVADELLLSVANYEGIALDQWAIVPDALHALLCLQNHPMPLQMGKPRTLTAFIAGLKAVTAKRINLVRNQPGSPVWQRSYKEQRMTDDLMLSRLRKRIETIEDAVISGQ